MPILNNFKNEFYRKIIHLSSSLIPTSIYLYGKKTVLPFIIFISLLFITIDILRIYNQNIKKIYNNFFSNVTRRNENNKLSGASWVFLGSSLSLLLFDEYTCIISLLVLSISDSIAAIIGIKYGKTKLFNKSLEGSSAFLFSSTIIILILSQKSLFTSYAAIITTTIVELFSNDIINDNISIPLVCGTILTLGM